MKKFVFLTLVAALAFASAPALAGGIAGSVSDALNPYSNLEYPRQLFDPCVAATCNDPTRLLDKGDPIDRAITIDQTMTAPVVTTTPVTKTQTAN